MKTFYTEELSPRERHAILLSGVAPRPIALVSTISEEGNVNLSPYSFFNAMSSNPPVVVFSPSYRGTDGTAKDTFHNILATRECTISAVPHSMVEQISLASSNYAPEVDEFTKAGLTPRPSVKVRAPGVAESPFILECSLMQHIAIEPGTPASGNIMICKVEVFHVNESAFVNGAIDPARLDLVARLGLNWYTRADKQALFELPKPRWDGIGFDALPEFILHSTILTANDLAQLAGVEAIPAAEADFITTVAHSLGYVPDSFAIELLHGTPEAALIALNKNASPDPLDYHRVAASFLRRRKVAEAWQTLLLVSQA